MKNVKSNLKKNKLGLSWAKLSSNWNWNWVLPDFRFVALSWLTKILMATLAATNKYPPQSISSKTLFLPYLHSFILACFLVCLPIYRVSGKTVNTFVFWISRQSGSLEIPSWTFFKSPFHVDSKNIHFYII